MGGCVPTPVQLALLRGMLDELEEQRLEVVLVPSRRWEEARRGGCIRAVVGRNPEWYRKLCVRHVSSRYRKSRKPDTRIKRQHVLRVLRRLVAGLPSTSPYVRDLVDLTRYARRDYIEEPLYEETPF